MESQEIPTNLKIFVDFGERAGIIAGRNKKGAETMKHTLLSFEDAARHGVNFIFRF